VSDIQTLLYGKIMSDSFDFSQKLVLPMSCSIQVERYISFVRNSYWA